MAVEKFRVAQKAILFNDVKQVLIVRFSGNGRTHSDLRGKWDFPGGGLTYNESLVEGVRRELREELGEAVRYELFEPLVMWDWVQAGDETMRTVCVGYRGKFLGGEITLNEEHDQYAWVAVEQLANYDWMKPDLEAVKRLQQLAREGKI